MKLLIQIITFFVFSSAIAQSNTNETAIFDRIEKYILDNQLDSANYVLKKSNISDSYTAILEKIINSDKNISYKQQLLFFNTVCNKQSIPFEKISHYVNHYIKEPDNLDQIDLDFVLIKWTQISKLRDEVSLEKASAEQKKLENYINQFDDSDDDVKRAKLRATTHPIVMYQIQEDVKNGKKLCLESLESAKKLNDKTLQIVFLYHLSDFLIIERKLEEYIEVSEESLKISNELPFKTAYYYSTIEHLIDAYIFKGGTNDKVLNLLYILQNNPASKIHSYSLFAKLIARLDKNSPILRNILSTFEVKDVKAFTEKIKILGKDLNPNDFLHLINESAEALVNHGFYKDAISYKNNAIQITQKIYSQDLSQSIANYKTEQAVKEKENEIVYQKEKSALYSVIALLAFGLFLITLMVLRKIKKQSKELLEKNRIINKTLKDKELLVKEVHHRVKNNFQIIASLLELQSQGIKDETALKIVNEGKNRITSMAIIHQKLYQNASGLVDFNEYIRLLVNELSNLYSSKIHVNTTISSKKMLFDVDTAIPLGLIINEIITNAYKYAFQADRENNLFISINKEEHHEYKLIIEDNGPGLSNNFDAKNAESLGLRLVNRLIKQLHGSLKQSNKNGAKFEILFKDITARQLVD